MGIFQTIWKLLGGRIESEEEDWTPNTPRGPSMRDGTMPGLRPTNRTSLPQQQQQPAARQQAAPRGAPPPPKRKSLGLDLGALEPLNDDQVAAGAKSLWRMSWGWNPRDRVPAVDDPRARLIEQGMLGRGLITTERLQEIHEVGAQYDELRPQWNEADRQARAAVKLSKDEYEAAKQQKKADAEARKQAKADAVAARHQADIVFLGRGVSKGLADRRANPEKLAAHGLPSLSSPADVARALELTIPQLRWLAFHSEAASSSHYTYFTIPKKSGGVRELAAPMPRIAACQQWILREILAKVPLHDAAHGFVTGRSTLTNAQPHVGRAVVVNADLSDFFPTIIFPRVFGLFKSLGYSQAAATILALVCTESPRRRVDYASQSYFVATGPRALPQGACTSPALSNLVARRLDSRLTGIATTLGWTYTRYADDLTLSCPENADDKIGYLMARLRHIAQDEGFAVNEKKTRVQRRSTRQSVTGLVVNDRAQVDRRTVRRIRAILHQAKSTGLEAQNREQHPDFEGWLRGMIAYIHMANPDQAAPLYRDLAAIGQ